jgi:TatD DNase family protein
VSVSASAAPASPPLVDIGANLTAAVFRDDLTAVLARAAQAGVAQIVVTGASVAASAEAAVLAAQHAHLFATAGVHPHHAQETDGVATWIDELRALSRRPRVVAIGECGLDYDRNFSPRADQLRCFEAQLALAAELALPVFLHERAAHADFIAVLHDHRRRLRAAVVHCFTGSGAELDAYLALDLHIGITGWICDERRGLHLRDLVACIPGHRLMIETDAPYLLPRTLPVLPRRLLKNRRNEPAFLPAVLAVLAAARGEDPGDTARATTTTARTFFVLPSSTPGTIPWQSSAP